MVSRLTFSQAKVQKRTDFLHPSLLTFGLLLLFTTAALAGVGGALRILFPAAACALGGFFLYHKKQEYFLELVIWLFLITPFIRRIVDLHAGYVSVNLLMLAPYTTSSLAIIIAINQLVKTNNFKFQLPFVMAFVTIIYGLVIALFEGDLFAGTFEAITWFAPISVGLLIAMDPSLYDRYRIVFVRSLIYGFGLISCYGIFQFVAPPNWDADWMINSQMVSIGLPKPFLVRVFSTMNSPASFAQDAVFGALVVLPLRGVKLKYIALVLIGVAVLLSMARTAWLGFAAGLIFILLVSDSAKMRNDVIVAFGAIVLAIPILLSVPQVNNVLSDRLSSFSSLQSDNSYDDRLKEYSDFLNISIIEEPLGGGFGSAGVRSAYVDKGTTNEVDGAPIQIGDTLGVVCGTIYLAAILMVFVSCLKIAKEFKDNKFIVSCAAVPFAAIIMLSGANVTVGECGIYFWICVGLCFSYKQFVESKHMRKAGVFSGY
jgi:hypothetical protein